MKKLLLGAGATAALLHSGFALSQVAAAAADAASGPTTSSQDLQSVIVTGTRTTGLRAVDSAAPVQVIDAGSLQRTGQTDVMQALATILPSFTAEATGFDTANLTLSARLRGLSPNDALLLINGKRRHTTANLHVDGGSPTSGAAAADLSMIPMAAVDHVEVLLDGAAAQYGTDAIAGVINIILKKNASGGQVDVTGGKYFDEGGRNAEGSVNIGLKPADGAFLSLTADTKYHGFSNRGAIDARLANPTALAAGIDAAAAKFPGFPYSNRISGDAQYHSTLFSYNAGVDVSDALQIYSFGTYGTKLANSFENYRVPHRIPNLYPLGFNPLETLDETDYGLTIGAKGMVAGWNWDLSGTIGDDFDKIGTIHSGNASLNGQYAPTNADGTPTNNYTPTDFHDGNFRTGQDTLNLDVTHDYEVGLATPLTLAVGGELRHDRYEITAGDPLSYYGSGAQSFVGYSPFNSGKYGRQNQSVYVDFAASPIKDLQVDAAARFEHYSDFGSAKVGKLTSRYDFTPTFAMRGTVSNGFRAPTLAEQFYSGNNVGPDSIYLQLPPNSAAAKALGIDNLKPEKSLNLSLGFVVHPTPASTVTLDIYQINLHDRVVASGSFTGYRGANAAPTNPKPTNPVTNQTVVDALTIQGVPQSTYVNDPSVNRYDGTAGIQFFNNGADTRTRGLDLVGSYASNYDQYGTVDWSLGGNLTITSLTKVAGTPTLLNSPGPILDQTAASVLTTATPKFKVNAAGLWKLGSWSVLLRETLYGRSSFYQQDENGNYINNTINTKILTDVEVADQVTSSWTFAIGAKNLFNTYPNKLNSGLLNSFLAAGDNSNVTQYPIISPFGINGGYYYARASYKF